MHRTIFAQATPPGRSGVAILRISGPDAFACLPALCVTTPLVPRRSQLHKLYHPHDGSLIDSVLLIAFPAPYSFTGENVLEIHHHGSIAIKQELLEVLSQIPHFHTAEPGEFTRQAFYNHKLDLAEAEGLADLIDAETIAQKKQALRQMSGTLSDLCKTLRQDALTARAYMEAILDFPDEDIPDQTYVDIENILGSLIAQIQKLLEDGHHGEKLREGFVGLIMGPPNAGKSSLLNLLAKRDVAIVSDIPGTTRDLIEVHLDLHGYPVTLIDTAGIRDAKDHIENEGIQRALNKLDEADILLYLQDIDAIDLHHFQTLNHPHKVLILNKCDVETQDIAFHVEQNSYVAISTRTNYGIDSLIDTLNTILSKVGGHAGNALITRSRHRKAFTEALEHLLLARSPLPWELKAEECRLATEALGKVVGAVDYESVLDTLFSGFCIGK